MQTIHINDSKELQEARKIILYSTLVGIFLGYISAFGSLSIIASPFLLVVYIVALVGFYRFSNLCNTFIFRLMIFSILLLILASLLSPFALFVPGFLQNDIETLIITSIICIAYASMQIYLLYLICYELAARTGQKEFITAFRLVCVCALLLVVGLFSSTMIESESRTIFSNYGIGNGGIDNGISNSNARSIQVSTFSIPYTIAKFVAIAAYGFFILGIYRIKEVTIREVNQIRLEK
ncbi:hypothetical protein BKN38_04485 [Helicobacter sp. CLO-3]|uniref:hypothetical protein n=1 Tax=unclassified Helicobacter TaxID=2593540 RepID=UPI00080526EC|nr:MULTISPECIES: hypothetical protein [unclassified Helicobacter]OBV29952.1 hypothetical protein BA723_03465 [Helicobacter sp. CLO-3]OHU83953.1 hypothetical protein BKN38_04485 [Helicobacter sp. CLO-3]